jgi:hypothetical protein
MNMSNHTAGKKKNNDPKPIKDEPFIARMTPFWGWKM